MNHCGVLRKMSGFFERQECGYWCFSRPRATRLPASIKRLDDGLVGIALIALVVDDALAGEARRFFGEEAVGIDGVGNARVDAARCELAPMRHPDVEVVAAVAGRGMDEARAGIVGDVIAIEEAARRSHSLGMFARADARAVSPTKLLRVDRVVTFS